jgi:hypothetical protein
MASAEILQRLLDANSNRIANLGTPTTANDATSTDNATAPQNPTAVAAAGASLLAAPANHVHQAIHSIHADASAQIFGDVQFVSGSGVALSQVGNAITVAVQGGLTNKFTFADNNQYYSSTTTIDILGEWVIDLDDAGTGVGPNIQARLAGITKVQGGTGTYSLYVGATAPGATTGATIRATFTSSSTSEALSMNLGAAFANPGGNVIVQLCASNGTASTKTYIRGISVSLG